MFCLALIAVCLVHMILYEPFANCLVCLTLYKSFTNCLIHKILDDLLSSSFNLLVGSLRLLRYESNIAIPYMYDSGVMCSIMDTDGNRVDLFALLWLKFPTSHKLSSCTRYNHCCVLIGSS